MVVTPLLIIFQLYPGRQLMVVTLLLIIFQLYPDGQFYWWRTRGLNLTTLVVIGTQRQHPLHMAGVSRKSMFRHTSTLSTIYIKGNYD
jgi:hypothetical protein